MARLLIAVAGVAFVAAQVPPKPAQCDGEPVSQIVIPVGQCTRTKTSGYELYSNYICNDTSATVEYRYFTQGHAPPGADNCSIPPNMTTTYAKGGCYEGQQSRGAPQLIDCNDTDFIIKQYSLAPPIPTVSCLHDPPSSTIHLKALHLAAGNVNIDHVDEVSFEVSLEDRYGGRPFFGYVVQVAKLDDVAHVNIPARPNTHYFIQARAHKRGQNEGNPGSWSNLSEAVKCSFSSTSSPIGEVTVSTPTSKGVKTRWLEVYRAVAQGSDLPDFLDQHNTYDMISAASNMGMMFTSGWGSRTMPFTRYCVEIEDVVLDGIITHDTSGVPQPSNFSDYASCISGQCICMVGVDRSWARMPAQQIKEMCPKDSRSQCKCPEAMLKQSNKYVGRAPMPIPVEIVFSLATTDTLPDSYPIPTMESPMGYIFHFPGAAQCKGGAQVGDDGCTWRLEPFTHTVFTDDLIASGLNTTAFGSMKSIEITVPKEASLHNIQVFQEAFQNLPVDIPACGAQFDGRGTPMKIIV